MKKFNLRKWLKRHRSLIKEQKDDKSKTPLSKSTPDSDVNIRPNSQFKKPSGFKDPGDKNYLDPERGEGLDMEYGCGDPRAINRNPKVVNKKPYHQPDDCCYIHGCSDRNATTFYCNWVQESNSTPYLRQTTSKACETIMSKGGLSQFECTGCESENSCNEGILPDGFIPMNSLCMTDAYGAVDTSTYFLGAIDGCTDPAALNYNPQANLDDGSCKYFECQMCTTKKLDTSSGNPSLLDHYTYWAPTNPNMPILQTLNITSWSGGGCPPLR